MGFRFKLLWININNKWRLNSFHQIHEGDIKHLTHLLLKVILDGVRYFTNSLVSLPIIGHLIPLAYLNVNIFSSSIEMQYNLLYFFNCVTIRTLLSSFSHVGRIGWANKFSKCYFHSQVKKKKFFYKFKEFHFKFWGGNKFESEKL